VKADHLLKHITDRKERTDPHIPGDLTNHLPRPKVNGQVNGRSHSRSLSANNRNRSPSLSTISKVSTPIQKAASLFPIKKTPRRDVPFPDTPAITRTPQGMTLFSQLDWEICQEAGPSRLPSGIQKDTLPPLVERLQQLSPLVQLDDEPEPESVHTPDDNAMLIDDVVGGKRKLYIPIFVRKTQRKCSYFVHRNGFTDHRPSKRARFSSQYATPVSFEKDELSELWWGAVQSDTLLANGLPHIPYPSSSSVSPSITLPQTKHPGPISKPRLKPKRRKKGSGSGSGSPTTEQPNSLLAMMNNNMNTMKRVRHTHAKFAALNMNLGAGGGEEDGEGGVGMFSGIGTGFGGAGGVAGSNVQDEDGIEAVDDKVDEQPWRARIKRKGGRRVGGIEIGEKNATGCVQWMGAKVLEHAGFQGLCLTFVPTLFVEGVLIIL
jgi:transcriptional activator SPT7